MEEDKQQIKDEIKKLLSERLDISIPPEKIQDDDNFIINLGLESIQVLELAVALEDKWKFVIEDDELRFDSLSTVNKLADFVLNKLNNLNQSNSKS